jgi:hypothetical protein
MRDKTIGHFHIDPVFVPQVSAADTLEAGQILYLDNDGLYKPALAVEDKQINIVGIVWDITPTGFYLRTTPGPMQYRLPLPASYFNLDVNGRPDENNPNTAKIPGNFGQKLYLSETIPGGLQLDKPAFAVIVGYKTKYGFIYRPDLAQCCEE